MNAIEIAEFAHNVIKAHCSALGDNTYSSWRDSSAEHREATVEAVNEHLHKDVGPETYHSAWMKVKVQQGWHWGLSLDPQYKEHPSMLPFGLLPKLQQAEGHLFKAVVEGMRGTYFRELLVGTNLAVVKDSTCRMFRQGDGLDRQDPSQHG